MRKFKSSLGAAGSAGKFKKAARKVQWGLHSGKKEDIDRLRNYLNIHIGTINMQLSQYGLERLDIIADERYFEHKTLKSDMDESLLAARQIVQGVQEQTLVIRNTQTSMRNLFNLIRGNVALPVRSLMSVVAQIW